LEGFPTSTPRLDRALTDKAATDAAVVAKSAERGCVENCRPLLQSPLADRLGWPAWLLDLLQSALGSIAANGLAKAVRARRMTLLRG
jgi:hypothetical protein